MMNAIVLVGGSRTFASEVTVHRSLPVEKAEGEKGREGTLPDFLGRQLGVRTHDGISGRGIIELASSHGLGQIRCMKNRPLPRLICPGARPQEPPDLTTLMRARRFFQGFVARRSSHAAADPYTPLLCTGGLAILILVGALPPHHRLRPTPSAMAVKSARSSRC